MIPKIIHQIWLGPNKRPDIWMDSWKINYIKKHPDWTYKLWTEKEISELKLINKEFYEKEPYYIGKADIARYEILYQFGGVFIDADSLWIEGNNISLNKILDMTEKSDMFCAVEPVHKQYIANSVIGFSKSHKTLKHVIYFINKNYMDLKSKQSRKRDVWCVTGPKIFTEIIKKYDTSLILESFYLYPESFHQNNLNIDINKLSELYPKSIMIHYGYTTNNILSNNIMKDFIDKL